MHYGYGNEDNSVRIVTSLQAEAPGLFPFVDRELSCPKRPFLLFDPPCHLCNEHCRLVHVGQVVHFMRKTSHHVVPCSCYSFSYLRSGHNVLLSQTQDELYFQPSPCLSGWTRIVQ